MDGRSFLSRSRPRLRSRARSRSRATASSSLLELETLSSYSALEARAVTLSADEALVVARLSQLLLDDTLRTLEATGGRADPREWKLVKRKDQLAVYKQRREAAALAAQRRAPDAAGDVAGDVAAAAQRETALPLLLVDGTLPSGTGLDDAMLGLVSPSTRALKLASAYCEDAAVVDAAVLAALEQPSAREPFRFLGLKWVARRHAGSLKKRDLLFLEATGVTRLPTGARVGYRVMHSVSVRALAQLGAVAVADSVVRAKLSLVQLFLEPVGSPGAPLRVFARGFYDPMGGMMHFVALNVAAELLLALAAGPADCAHLQKIARAAQRAQRDRQRRRRRSTATAMAAASPALSARKPSRFPAASRYQPDSSHAMLGIAEVDETMTASLGLPTLVAAPAGLDDDNHDHSLDHNHDHNDGMRDEPALELSPSMCHVCECSLGGVFDRSAAPCTICFHMVCSRCSVTKKLRFAWSDARGLGLPRLDASGADASGGITASSTSHASTERSRSRSRSRSGSGAAAAFGVAGGAGRRAHGHLSDVAAKPLNFCLPCVVAAGQQSAEQLAVDAAAGAAARTRAQSSQMDGVTPVGRATAPSAGYGGRPSTASVGSAAASTPTQMRTPTQRWSRGSSVYGARPTFDLLGPATAAAVAGDARASQTQAAAASPYFPQPQHQFRVYGSRHASSAAESGSTTGSSSSHSSLGVGDDRQRPSQRPSSSHTPRAKAFSLATPLARDSAPKVVLLDMDDYLRRSSRM